MTTQDATEQKPVRFIDIVPPEWFPTEESTIWVTGYRVLRAPLDLFSPEPHVVDFGNVRGLILYGSLTYFDTAAARIELKSANEWHIDWKDVKEKNTQEGRYVVLMTPLPNQSAKPTARAAIESAAGLLAVINGRNMVWECLYENIIRPKGRAGITQTWESPLAFPEPDLSDTGRDRITRCVSAFSHLAGPMQARFGLSLRWLGSAVRDSGVDAVLKYWIALETLAMPDDTNIRPINESLKRSYNKPMGEVVAKFGVGRLFGFRSRIVHKGAIVPVHQNLLRYLEALYTDVLLDFLNQPPEHRALAVLEQPGFNIREYLVE